MTNLHPVPDRRQKIRKSNNTSTTLTTPFLTFHFLTSLATSSFNTFFQRMCTSMTSMDRTFKLVTDDNHSMPMRLQTWSNERHAETKDITTLYKLVLSTTIKYQMAGSNWLLLLSVDESQTIRNTRIAKQEVLLFYIINSIF
jgi:hypothetical protein